MSESSAPWDDWVPVNDILAYVIPGAASEERERIARARKAGNAIPEAKVIEACERVGIEVRWDHNGVTLTAYVPCWACPFYEATIVGSAQQTRVLRRALRDQTYRDAGLTVWRLQGIDGLTGWLGLTKLEDES